MRAARLLVGLAVLMGLLVPVTSASGAVSVPPPAAKIKGDCKSIAKVAAQWHADTSRVAIDRTVVFDGRTISLTPSGWRAAYSASLINDPSWALWFHSLVWDVQIAVTNPNLAVQMVIDQAAALPDPGAFAPTAEQVATGWTPGNIRNRLRTVKCLYVMTGDQRLLPVGRALGDALMDPHRYTGWPLSEPHNHGALTSLVLLSAAKTFDRSQWRSVSLERLTHDMPHVFSRCGMAHEQSSGYQALNVSLWTKVATLVDYRLAGPLQALRALARPDGVLEKIGDGDTKSVHPNGKALWCSNLGWAANTLPGGTHYILRFGPAIRYHGHNDHGALTWFADGVPVLSDRGLYDKTRNARFTYAQGMSAHSVLEPVGVAYNPETSGVRAGKDAYQLRDSLNGITRERSLAIDRRNVTVTDSAWSFSGSQQWIQHWQLAPGWTPRGNGAVYTDGTRITISCEGGTLQPVQVESYPDWREVVPAWDMQCRATGSYVHLTTRIHIQ